MSGKRFATAVVSALLLAGCAPAQAQRADGFEVVASTPIIADLVSEVAGPNAKVTTLVPLESDPHSYEPPLRAVRDVAWADLAFANGLLLESGATRHTLEANLREGVRLVNLAERAPAYGGRHMRLVEDFALSTVWLGFRSQNLPGAWQIRATSVDGPGSLAAFTTGTFGNGRPHIVSGNGLSNDDVVALPPDAHTHMSWAFSDAGSYTLRLIQEPHPDALDQKDAEASKAGDVVDGEYGEASIKFVVGYEPDAHLVHLDSGHVDITATPQGIKLLADEDGVPVYYDPDEVVVVVPNRTLTKVPQGDWSFLGKPGQDTWILAQAVLGEHIHGEIDPHLWHDVKNVIAYVDIIAEELAMADPNNAEQYLQRAARYKQQLAQLDSWVAAVIFSIPEQNRKLVTAHDAFGYLASRYGLEVAGFVAPNPSIEPSSKDMAILARQLRDLHVPAVFDNPASNAHQAELQNAARSANVNICAIYPDSLTKEVSTYMSLIEQNVKSLKKCLDPASLGAWPVVANQVLKGTS